MNSGTGTLAISKGEATADSFRTIFRMVAPWQRILLAKDAINIGHESMKMHLRPRHPRSLLIHLLDQALGCNGGTFMRNPARALPLSFFFSIIVLTSCNSPAEAPAPTAKTPTDPASAAHNESTADSTAVSSTPAASGGLTPPAARPPMPTDAEISSAKAFLSSQQGGPPQQIDSVDYICAAWNNRHGDWMPVFHTKVRIFPQGTDSSQKDVLHTNSYIAQTLNLAELVPIGSEVSLTLAANLQMGSYPDIPEVKEKADGSCDLSQATGDVQQLEK